MASERCRSPRYAVGAGGKAETVALTQTALHALHGHLSSVENTPPIGHTLPGGHAFGGRGGAAAAAADLGPASQIARRVAVCITGQIRALPLAELSWQRSGLLQALRAGGAQLDVFLVTSNTSSLAFWRSYVDSLKPVRVHVVSKYAFAWFDSSSQRSRSEAKKFGLLRETEGTVTIDPQALPRFADMKQATAFIQHYQMRKCGELIRQHEQAVGVRYDRVARLRTDVVYGGFSTANSSSNPSYGRFLRCARAVGADGSLLHCAESLRSEKRAVLSACEEHLSSLSPLRHWFVASDFGIFGSRSIVVDGLFQGLEALAKAKREGLNYLRTLLAAWPIIRTHAYSKVLGAPVVHVRNLSKRTRHGNNFLHSADLNGGACVAAFGSADVVRVAGPPTLRYFLQFSEQLQRTGHRRRLTPALLPECAELLGLEDCVDLLWSLDVRTADSCLGLRYDEWPLEGARATARAAWNATLLRGADEARRWKHMNRFGDKWVGDVRLASWSAGKSSSSTLRTFGKGRFAKRQLVDGFRR